MKISASVGETLNATEEKLQCNLGMIWNDLWVIFNYGAMVLPSITYKELDVFTAYD